MAVFRKTIRKRLQSKIKEVKIELRRRMHTPIPDQAAYLRSVVAGHVHYFGVPWNSVSIGVFRKEVCRLWLKVVRRRSHKHKLTWNRMERFIAKWIPPCPCLSSLSITAPWRYHPRQEPAALVAGVAGKAASLMG